MENPLVSIVIPAYNAEKYLDKAIFSVLIQKYDLLEIIIVNDGSTDKTENIIRDWTLSESNIKGIHLDENKGAGNALRLGFEAAKGDYVCWLSVDDEFIDVYKTKKQVKLMQQTNADWSYYPQFQMGITLENSKKVIAHYIPYVSFFDNMIERDNRLLFLSLLFHNPINGSTTMFKRETSTCFGNFDSALKRADADGDLWLRYSLLGAKVARASGSSILYRTHPDQVSRDTITMLYGSEITRCRALKSIEDIPYCYDAMIDTNKWLLYAMFLLKQYKKRPFVSYMLCSYIIKYSSSHSFVKFCRRILRDVDMYIKNNLDWSWFEHELDRIMQSGEYKTHLDKFIKRQKNENHID